jgi:hypothetical protein
MSFSLLKAILSFLFLQERRQVQAPQGIGKDKLRVHKEDSEVSRKGDGWWGRGGLEFLNRREMMNSVSGICRCWRTNWSSS